MGRASYAPTHSKDTSSDSDTDSLSSTDSEDNASPTPTPRPRTTSRPSLLWLMLAIPIVLAAGAGVVLATRSNNNSSDSTTATKEASSSLGPVDTSHRATSSGFALVTSASKTNPTSGKAAGTSSSSTAKASGSSTSSASATAASGTRKVFAHVLQGLSQDSTADEWASDIALAKAAGIDGAMNVGHDDTDSDQMALVFKTTAEAGDFVLFFSFDCNHFNTEGSSDIILSDYLVPYALNDVYYKVDGASFVSTFAGDNAATYLDGNSDITATWSALISSAESQSPSIPIYFVPCPLGDSDTILDIYDGVMRWFAWPLDDSAPSVDTDVAFVKATRAKNQTYMAPIGAFFFAHYNADTNYIFKSDDWLLPTHYQQVIEMDTQPDWIELLTWNDYSESHYLGPLHDTSILPGTNSLYVNSTFDHTPMLTLSSYYNRWYKTGSPPSIATETVIWWYRPHPTAATASSDTLDRPSDVEWLEDSLYAAVLIPEGSPASSLVFTTGGKAQESQSVSAGVNLLKVAFSAGSQSIALLDGSGNSVLLGDGWAITDSPETYNYNYWCGILPADASPSTMLSS
ncbi:glycosyl hydrolase family 71-domain-containing protein [Leucosporidium creatinivorum]|uniref:Glycosyl hydrolase family 71-domain-containing protein n=1 Tax=Leucosporidium creatinivorum TaxID=106004 RepID=A0A1Y2EQI2_9BASI|nr:glycosyl hydrolase family 71-domain-containing protein [Leucosporidium creatinivorum]